MTKTEALIHQHTFGVNPYQDQLIEEVQAQYELISELEEMLRKECQHSADQKLRADQMSQHHSTQAALNSEARKELAEIKLAATQPAAQGMLDAMTNAFITSESDGAAGSYKLVVKFQTLPELQAAHNALVTSLEAQTKQGDA